MKIGGLYEFLSESERALFSDQQYLEYLNFEVSRCMSTIFPKEIVVLLDKAIVEYYDTFFGDTGYETFMKVVTNKGLVGWVVWRDYEWRSIDATK